MTGVYLAQPIDQAADHWREARLVERWLSRRFGWVYDPTLAFRVQAQAARDQSIRRINQTALDQADLLVAWLPAGVPSVGVPMEIEHAVMQGKYALVISDAPSWMLEYGSDRVLVVPEWGPQAQGWVTEVLRGISEGLGAPGGALLPVLLDPGAEAPLRGYEDDAGMDLVVSENTEVEPGAFVDIPCGVSVALPDWSWGLIIGRSSTLRKRGLMVNQGVIDAGYRGPLFAGVWNLTDKPVFVSKGERIAQLIVIANSTLGLQVAPVQQLPAGSRGNNGFGSTGA